MLTATRPSNQQCWTNDDHLATDRPTWLHALGAVGHRPHLIGRMHAMGPDQLHGYVTREVGDHSPNWAGIPRHDMGVLDRANDPNPESLERCGAGTSAYESKDRDVTSAALAALDRIAAVPEEARDPFCLTVGFMLPHAPYVASRDWVDLYRDALPPPTPPDAREHEWIAWWRENRGIAGVDEATVREARAAYWGLVSTLDGMIGAILDRLRETGLDRDTLVVYASDHGDHAGDRGLWWKHTLYDESALVPLVMSCPGTLPEGATDARVCDLTDVAQTMVEALGGTPLPADGRSFWRHLTGEAEGWDDVAFSEYCTDAVPEWTGGMAVRQRMVRRGRFKLHFHDGYRDLLFDMAADPGETRDLAADPDHAGVLAELRALALADWDPREIEAVMRVRRERKDVLAAWARETRPPSTHVWPMRADMNRLDRPDRSDRPARPGGAP